MGRTKRLVDSLIANDFDVIRTRYMFEVHHILNPLFWIRELIDESVAYYTKGSSPKKVSHGPSEWYAFSAGEPAARVYHHGFGHRPKIDVYGQDKNVLKRIQLLADEHDVEKTVASIPEQFIFRSHGGIAHIYSQAEINQMIAEGKERQKGFQTDASL